MTLYAAIGAKALYLLFVWLLSCAAAAWLADRKGYTERVGLTLGLVLTFVGLLIVLILPARPGSAWKLDGPFPSRRRHAAADEIAAPAAGADTTPPEPPAGEPPSTSGA